MDRLLLGAQMSYLCMKDLKWAHFKGFFVLRRPD